MAEQAGAVRHISDTALWAAYFRAEETKRKDALFQDVYAEKLERGRGTEIAKTIPWGQANAWAWVTRTYLFDKFLREEIENGADLIVNCAAGLDARPYRMNLPANLHWVELDLPDILSYKEEILAAEQPRCLLERIRVDLANELERERVFASVASRGKRGIVLTEGLLIYLAPEQVGTLARDLAASGSFHRWILDIHSPGLLRMMQRRTGKALAKAGVPFRFGPAERAGFFRAFGWEAVQVESLLKTAARFGRPPWLLRLLAKLPESKEATSDQPWAGVCLLENRKLG